MDLIIGSKYGRLTVLGKSTKKVASGSVYLCLCDCGNTLEVARNSLVSNHTKSCGCIHKEQIANIGRAHQIHGYSQERLYKVWDGMKQRCYNPKSGRYKHYGGRGIKICDEWVNNYSNFRQWSYQNGYDQNAKRGQCTIDRIDVNGNYEPNNCRWVDSHIQALNKRRA